MLHRIGEREEIAPGALQAVAQRDQLLPAVDGDEPVELQVAGELLGVLHPEIRHVAIRPDERMKRLDVAHGGAVLLAPVDLHRPGVAHLDRDDARRRIGAEEHRVFLETSSRFKRRGFMNQEGGKSSRTAMNLEARKPERELKLSGFLVFKFNPLLLSEIPVFLLS